MSEIQMYSSSQNFSFQPDKHHYKWIDVIRATSALLIVLFHYTYRYDNNPYIVLSESQVNYPIQVSWGYGAVITFFMLSGFLISHNFINTNKNPINFATKRVVRLYPTFWICVILTTIVIIFVFPEIKINPIIFIANLTMVPVDFHQPYIDGAYWTMGYEIKFTIFLLFILLYKNLNIRKLWLFFWLLSSIAVGFCSNYFHPTLIRILKDVFLMDFIHTFIGGISIANFKFSPKFYTTLLSLSFINQYCWLGFDMCYDSFFLITVVLLFIIPMLEMIKINDTIYKIIEFIALISYPLYLLHQMIGFGIIRALVNNGLSNEIGLIIPFTISVLLAVLVHKFVEIPSAKWDFMLWPKLKSKFSKGR